MYQETVKFDRWNICIVAISIKCVCVCVCLLCIVCEAGCFRVCDHGSIWRAGCVLKVSKYGISPPSAVRRVYFAIITLGSLGIVDH